MLKLIGQLYYIAKTDLNDYLKDPLNAEIKDAIDALGLDVDYLQLFNEAYAMLAVVCQDRDGTIINQMLPLSPQNNQFDSFLIAYIFFCIYTGSNHSWARFKIKSIYKENIYLPYTVAFATQYVSLHGTRTESPAFVSTPISELSRDRKAWRQVTDDFEAEKIRQISELYPLSERMKLMALISRISLGQTEKAPKSIDTPSPVARTPRAVEDTKQLDELKASLNTLTQENAQLRASNSAFQERMADYDVLKDECKRLRDKLAIRPVLEDAETQQQMKAKDQEIAELKKQMEKGVIPVAVIEERLLEMEDTADALNRCRDLNDLLLDTAWTKVSRSVKLKINKKKKEERVPPLSIDHNNGIIAKTVTIASHPLKKIEG